MEKRQDDVTKFANWLKFCLKEGNRPSGEVGKQGILVTTTGQWKSFGAKAKS